MNSDPISSYLQYVNDRMNASIWYQSDETRQELTAIHSSFSIYMEEFNKGNWSHVTSVLPKIDRALQLLTFEPADYQKGDIDADWELHRERYWGLVSFIVEMRVILDNVTSNFNVPGQVFFEATSVLLDISRSIKNFEIGSNRHHQLIEDGAQSELLFNLVFQHRIEDGVDYHAYLGDLNMIYTATTSIFERRIFSLSKDSDHDVSASPAALDIIAKRVSNPMEQPDEEFWQNIKSRINEDDERTRFIRRHSRSHENPQVSQWIPYMDKNLRKLEQVICRLETYCILNP